MPKIRLTKTELKRQRDALKQFTRFLPTLQLKKQQLQMEMRKCEERRVELEREAAAVMAKLEPWVGLFADPGAANWLREHLRLIEIVTGRHNIAGVDVPVYRAVRFQVAGYDLFQNAPWLDDALRILQRLVELRARRDIIAEQHRRLGHELRITTQRVNLFEKVKIPEAKENIRVIQINLGDQQTAAVGRGKIAKRKLLEVAA
jgi:V/A-type H+-transporting ATPase subunit D